MKYARGYVMVMEKCCSIVHMVLVLIFLSLFHTTDLYTVKLLLKPLNKVFSFVSYFYCSYKFL